MRIVVDMQGAQTPFSAKRGVGRYTRDMVRALIGCLEDGDEIFLALNGTYRESCEELMALYEDVLPREYIKVWQWYPVQYPAISRSRQDAAAGDYYREWFLQQFDADIIWSTNLQEGFMDENVSATVGLMDGNSLVTTTLHDVIPLIYSDVYLQKSYNRAWYYSKIEYAAKCDFIMTGSQYSKARISELMGVPADDIYVAYDGANRELFYRADDYRNLSEKDGSILYVGGADEHKNLKRLIAAYSLLPAGLKKKYRLVLAGSNPLSEKDVLMKAAAACGVGAGEIEFPGFIPDDELRRRLQTCAVFVMPSYSEGFGLPALEAMECGAPVLAADAASLTEIVADKRFMFDPYDEHDMSEKIRKVLEDADFAVSCIDNGQLQRERFTWEQGARSLYAAFKSRKKHTGREKCTVDGLIGKLATFSRGEKDAVRAGMAYSIEDARLFTDHVIYVDTSAVVVEDYVTGIQRVVNGIIAGLRAICGTEGGSVIPVYSEPGLPCFYRSDYRDGRYVKREQPGREDIVQFHDGDLLLLADLNPANIIEKKDLLRAMTVRGVRVISVLYDLIPTVYPEFYDKRFLTEYEQYLEATAEFGGVVAISRSVLNAYTEWCGRKGIHFPAYYIKTYNYLGADISRANPSKGLPDGYEAFIEKIRREPTFLIVSTIEPRKKQEQVLDAMELLWQKGITANLVLVGRYGWKMDDFIKRIQNHSEYGRRFYWLTGISDEYLDMIYDSASAVIAASLIEGFGLSIIEAAMHGKPVILRDIEVFREVAGDSACYFKAEDGAGLAESLEGWLNDYSAGKVTAPDISYISWEESSRRLLEKTGFKLPGQALRKDSASLPGGCGAFEGSNDQ